MYSAVLMLALTAGGEAVDFGRNRCQGSSASCATATTTSTKAVCSTSCSARPRLFGNLGHGCSKSHGCSTTTKAAPATPVVATTCSKSHGCSASRGCHGGGLLSKLRNRGCAKSCATTTTTCSSTVVEKKKMPKSEEVKPPVDKKKTGGDVSAPATIVVSLPAGARLIVDGAATSSNADRRTLVTPELESGSTYVYTMRAEVVRNGQIVAMSQDVLVRSGETANVEFDFSTQGIASR